MEKKQVKGTTLKERVAREAELKEGIKGLQTKLGSLSLHWPLGESPGELKTRIDSLIQRYGGGNEASIADGRAKAELRDLKAQHEVKLAKSMDITAQRNQLQAELTALKEELRNFTYTADVKEVMEHQGKISEAALGIASLKSAISEQEAIVAANTGLTVGDLYQKRQDLLAKSVLGTDVTADIEILEVEIKAKEATLAECEKVKTNAEHAIAGLKRKLAEADNALRLLQSEKKAIVHHFLVSQAEQVGSVYLKAAAELEDAYGRLMGLDEIILSLGLGSASYAIGAFQIDIPSFQLKVFGGEEFELGSTKVFHGRGFDTAAARQEELTRLKEIGVVI